MILWLDLETTGSEGEDEILEIGAQITHDNLTPYGLPFERIIPVEESELLKMDSYVQQMHKDSGLWEDVLSEYNKCAMGAQYEDLLAEVEHDIMIWLDQHDAPKHGIPLGGKGVSSFDLPLVRYWMPDLAERLAYYTYDVSPVRRFFSLAGKNVQATKPETAHRALDDALAAIEDAQQYVEWLKGVDVSG